MNQIDPSSQGADLQDHMGNTLEHNHGHADTLSAPSPAQDPSLTAPPDGIRYPSTNPSISPDLLPGDIIIDRLDRIDINPIQLAKRTVSGSYSGTSGGFRLDLRMDVDGTGNLGTASFDFFSVGSAVSYHSSFVMSSVSLSYTSTLAILTGNITGTLSLWANRVQIRIPRNTILQTAAAATVTFYQNTVVGSVYTCTYQSQYFRTVKLETDFEVGAALAGDYNTALMTNPGPNRVLNTVKAYQEAGINLVYTGANNSIATTDAGPDSRWTESEMHASMVRHFSAYSANPNWAVWLFAARRATSSTLLGIMFDYLGSRPHRQGCAVFQDTIRDYHPSANDYNRHLLYTYVHELGHAFNLLHSWDKSRPDSLSWMNYDWRYDQRNGLNSYWSNFNFRFDSQEIRHMRHGFRNAVIMGGNDWAVGAGLEAPHSHGDVFAQVMLENNTGLKLEIDPGKRSWMLGEPVVVEIKLRCMDLNGKEVNSNLHPKYDQVKIGILTPGGQLKTYENVAHLCAKEQLQVLTPENNTAYSSAYIGYGKDGFYFDQPGLYRIKGAYLTKDGSIIQSEEVTIRVKSPLTKTEDEIADAYMSNDAGWLFTLLGSDSPDLQSGMNDLRTVADKYKSSDLAVYANLVVGVNEGMKFKIADSHSGQVETRGRDLTAAAGKLTKVFNASKGDEGIDNITLNWAYRHLAKAFLQEGDEQTAKATLKAMEDTFRAKKLKPAVQQKIAQQADQVMRQA